MFRSHRNLTGWFALLVSLGLGLALFDLAQAADLAPSSEQFPGDYHLLRAAVGASWPNPDAKAKTPLPFTLLAAFRAGELVSVWAHGVSATPAPIHLRGSTARLTGTGAHGRFELVFGDGTTKFATRTLPLELDLVRSGSAVTGALVVAGTRAAARGEVLSQASLASTNAFAAKQAWPAWQGVDAGVRGLGGGEWVDSFRSARPLWRSEAALPVCFGSAADFRYPLRAAVQGPVGGASSPVVADGRVFTFHYQPAGDMDEAAFKQWVAREQDAFAALPDYQQAWVRDLFRITADDVVIAHDAATGRALWRTTLPGRDLNLQTHKHRGVSPTPLAADGALFVVNYRGRVARLDAATGAVRWEFPAAPTLPLAGKVGQAGSGDVPVGCASPVLLAGALGVTLKDELVALAADTGQLRWRVKVGLEAELRAWDGAFVAIGIERPLRKGEPERTWVTCLNADDGKVRWRAQVDFERHYRLPILTDNLLLGYRFGAAAANNISLGQTNTLLAYRLTTDGLQPAWRLVGLPAVVDSYGLAAHGGRAFLSGEKEIWAIALKDGRVTAKVAGTGGARTQVLWSAGDRLFLSPEGRHGSCWLTMLDTRGEDLRLLGAEEFRHLDWRGAWPVANPFTTAYSQHQLIHPVVAGRLFVRGGDGLYCYDLRQP